MKWNRYKNAQGESMDRGVCEFANVESMLKSLRLLDGVEIEEDYELRVIIGESEKEFLRNWREMKKSEWIKEKKEQGIYIDPAEIEEKEANEEPLEWELQLISKDPEIREQIKYMLTKRKEIELISGVTEVKPEEEKKKEISMPISARKFETQRAKERQSKKEHYAKKYENLIKEEIRKIERKEEDRERMIEKNIENKHLLERKKLKYHDKMVSLGKEGYSADKYRNSKDYLKLREVEKIKDNEIRQRYYPERRFKYFDCNYASNKTKNSNDYGLVILEKEKNSIHLYDNDEYIRNEKNEEKEATTDIVVKSTLNNTIENTDDIIVEDEKIIVNVEDKTKKILNKKRYLEDDEDDNKANIHIDESKFIIDNINKEIENNKKHRESKEIREKALKEKMKNTDMIQLQKNIFADIPKDKKALFEFNIPWDDIIENDLIEEKLKPWIKKKITELLGDEMSEFEEYIIKSLYSQVNPDDLINELTSVLDTDTENFVISLWKNLIFEGMKYKKLKEL